MRAPQLRLDIGFKVDEIHEPYIKQQVRIPQGMLGKIIGFTASTQSSRDKSRLQSSASQALLCTCDMPCVGRKGGVS